MHYMSLYEVTEHAKLIYSDKFQTNVCLTMGEYWRPQGAGKFGGDRHVLYTDQNSVHSVHE